jgi:hypothetical protein
MNIVVSNRVTAGTGSGTAVSALNIVPITGAVTGCTTGDTIDCYCDGLFWYCVCTGLLVGAFTNTA